MRWWMRWGGGGGGGRKPERDGVAIGLYIFLSRRRWVVNCLAVLLASLAGYCLELGYVHGTLRHPHTVLAPLPLFRAIDIMFWPSHIDPSCSFCIARLTQDESA